MYKEETFFYYSHSGQQNEDIPVLPLLEMNNTEGDNIIRLSDSQALITRDTGRLDCLSLHTCRSFTGVYTP